MKKPPARPSAPAKAPTDTPPGDRIAKVLSRAGIASRREAERMIEDGRVTVNGETIASPARNVTDKDRITVDGKPLEAPEAPRMWLYHKPAGLVTTTKDEQGRETIFDKLPEDLPRVMTVGRLDLNSEGLLLLTNDGALARALELPKNELERTYRVRAKGTVTDYKIAELAEGITVDGVDYKPITAVFDRETGANSWLTVTLSEGKKREVRRALEAVNLMVNRLIRVQYGPFLLDDLRPGAVEEVPADLLQQAIGHLMTNEHAARPPEPARPTRGSGKPAPKSRLGKGPASARVGTRKRKPKK